MKYRGEVGICFAVRRGAQPQEIGISSQDSLISNPPRSAPGDPLGSQPLDQELVSKCAWPWACRRKQIGTPSHGLCFPAAGHLGNLPSLPTQVPSFRKATSSKKGCLLVGHRLWISAVPNQTGPFPGMLRIVCKELTLHYAGLAKKFWGFFCNI